MSSSNLSRSMRRIGVLSGGSLLLLAVAAGNPYARERSASAAPSHSTRDIGHPASTGLEPCTSGCSGTTSTPSAAPAPAGTPTGDGLSAGSRTAPSVTPPQNTRGKATERNGGKRLFRRSGDGRVVPPAPLEEPRRGGVGTLIGITFA